jgi:hypothetical protein
LKDDAVMMNASSKMTIKKRPINIGGDVIVEGGEEEDDDEE